MAATPSKSGDLTGQRRDALLKEQSAESKKRAEEAYAEQQAETQSRENEIVDVTGDASPVVVDEIVPTTVDEDTVVIRVAEDLEQVTIGEKTYDFEAGKKYKVERNVADVLRWSGKLYERL